jgi:hypothetical protein
MHEKGWLFCQGRRNGVMNPRRNLSHNFSR